MPPRIAIIGAGLAGVTLAKRLAGAMDVTLVEKSRGVAGRMSTRRLDDQVFDHGAQYFTVRDERFAAMLEPFQRDGIIAPWDARFVTVDQQGQITPREMNGAPMIALPGMTGLAKAMAEDLDIMLAKEATLISKSPRGWQISDQDGAVITTADIVVTAIPAAQAARLLPDVCLFQDQLDQVRMLGCFTLMLGFDTGLDLGWDATFVEESVLGFVADNASRPGRGPATALTVQANNHWAEDYLDAPAEEVEAMLEAALSERLGIDAAMAARRRFHRWRYASVATPLGRDFAYDAENGLAAIGDWCLRGRVEAAFQSATALADRLLSDH